MAAQGLQAHEALVVYVFYEVADLVCVRGDHHTPVAATFLRPDNAPKSVSADLIRQRAKLLACYLALPLLPPGDTGRLVQRHAFPFQRVRAEPNNSAKARQSISYSAPARGQCGVIS